VINIKEKIIPERQNERKPKNRRRERKKERRESHFGINLIKEIGNIYINTLINMCCIAEGLSSLESSCLNTGIKSSNPFWAWIFLSSRV